MGTALPTLSDNTGKTQLAEWAAIDRSRLGSICKTASRFDWDAFYAHETTGGNAAAFSPLAKIIRSNASA